MNKEELEIAKKIAEIEGLDLVDVVFGCGTKKAFTFLDGRMDKMYDPFDWSILGPLMVKHKVHLDHIYKSTSTWSGTMESCGRVASIDFKSEQQIPRAILECIIKSKEKQND